MAEPKLRFKRDDGSNYPAWTIVPFSKLSVPSGVKNKNHVDLESYSISNDKGFVPQNEQFEDAGYLNNADRSLYYIVSPGSFAYNPARINIGSIGYQNVGKDVLVSSLYEIFNTTDELDDGFLMNWFKTEQFQKHVGRLSEGGVRQYFYYDKLCMVKFSLPCLEEQKKIADFLSSVDDIITASEEEVANLETQKKAVMKKVFLQEIRFKRADGSDFPEWEYSQFGDIIKNIQTGTNLLGNASNNGMPLIKMGNLQRGFFSLDKVEYLEGRAEPENIINFGDFVINTRNTLELVGKGATWTGESGTYAFNSNIARLTLLKVDTFFFNYLYNTPRMIREIHSCATGTTSVAAIYPRFMANIEVPIPCLEEQRLIADFLSDFDEAIVAAKKELELWKELKKGLLQQMFV